MEVTPLLAHVDMDKLEDELADKNILDPEKLEELEQEDK